MAHFSIPDIILEYNMQTVRQDLVKMMENDDRNFNHHYSNAQNGFRPILGRRSSLPLPETYPRKMSGDSVVSDGYLFSKTTLLPVRSSYFDEIRPRDYPKSFSKKFSRKNSFNSLPRADFLRLERPMSLRALNIVPKRCPRPKEKDLLQRLKLLEDNLLNFVTLSSSLNALQPTEFPVVERDTGIINGLSEYFAYLIKMAIAEEFWISSIAPSLNLRDKFLDSFYYLCHELHDAIADAEKFTYLFRLEESHELNESIDALNYWIRVFYTFVWLTLRVSGNVCQVQERNLFIGV